MKLRVKRELVMEITIRTSPIRPRISPAIILRILYYHITVNIPTEYI